MLFLGKQDFGVGMETGDRSVRIFYWPTGGPRYNKDLIVSAGGQYVEQVGVVKRQVVRHSRVHPCRAFLQGEEDFLLCLQKSKVMRLLMDKDEDNELINGGWL